MPSRRTFLASSALISAGTALAACAPAPSSAPAQTGTEPKEGRPSPEKSRGAFLRDLVASANAVRPGQGSGRRRLQREP